MGKRGPKRKPTSELKLTGSWRLKEREAKEPIVDCRVPNPPKWLSPAGRAHWKDSCERLLLLRVIAESDRDGVANYCESLAEWLRARNALDEDRSQQSLHQNHHKAAERLRQWTSLMGFTPSDRSRLVRIESKGTKLDSPHGRKSSLNTG